MKRRFLCALLCAVILLSFVPFTASAASGKGTRSDPYIIYTLKDLEELRDNVNNGNSYSGKYIKLMNDITMNTPDTFAYDEDGVITGAASGKTPYLWIAIGNSNRPFSGTFDGNGYRITGIYINNNSDYQGLFGCCFNASIQNLGLEDGRVVGKDYVGGVVGYNYAGESTAAVSGCYSTCSVIGNRHVGGLVGYNDAYDGTATVNRCRNTGPVTGVRNVGGVAGYSGAYEALASVTECFNTGAVNGSGSSVGGVVGISDGDSTVKNCYNTGSVTGKGDITGGVGGVVGSAMSYNDEYYSCSPEITNCYNVGSVNGSNIGGVVGYNEGDIYNCYYLNASVTAASVGTALTASQMRKEASFAGFDFDSVWTMDGAPDYPYPQLRMSGELTLGDIDGDGEIGAVDYVMVKRSVLGTYTLSASQIQSADVNKDGSIDAIDYAMIKRHVLGTYTIQ